MLDIGDLAPDFELPGSGGTTTRLSDLRPGKVVVYFYPKDDTPGCTTEALDFTALAPEFAAAGTTVLGISRDTVSKHEKFIAKHGLAIRLLADDNGAVCESYGAWQEKSMYGRKYMGIDRSTFVIDGSGKITHIWRGVKVKGQAHEVLDAAKTV